MKSKVVFVVLEQFADWEYAPLAAVLNASEDAVEQWYDFGKLGLYKALAKYNFTME